MSDVLTRIRVKEEHGIRRFLYPLAVDIGKLPPALIDALYKSDPDQITILTAGGRFLPLEIVRPRFAVPALRFAISLAPYEAQELTLVRGKRVLVDDALRVSVESIEQVGANDDKERTGGPSLIHSQQQQFSISYTTDGAIQAVKYDEKSHLRAPSRIDRNGETPAQFENTTVYSKPNSMFTRSEAHHGHFADNAEAHVMVETTACKSWINVVFAVEEAKEGDTISFTLPFAARSSTLACDFGVGNGTYGKLQQGLAEEVLWRTEFAEQIRWSVAVAGRTDYMGEVATANDFAGQAWCHLLDHDKSLAVAMTLIPAECIIMTVTMRGDGEVIVQYQLGKVEQSVVGFGVCYHFLNDIPAIAAATNPQSILLPPTVEVLPA